MYYVVFTVLMSQEKMTDTEAIVDNLKRVMEASKWVMWYLVCVRWKD